TIARHHRIDKSEDPRPSIPLVRAVPLGGIYFRTGQPFFYMAVWKQHHSLEHLQHCRIFYSHDDVQDVEYWGKISTVVLLADDFFPGAMAGGIAVYWQHPQLQFLFRHLLLLYGGDCCCYRTEPADRYRKEQYRSKPEIPDCNRIADFLHLPHFCRVAADAHLQYF